jgi:F0F1-type ATP synthase epsilon subunit
MYMKMFTCIIRSMDAELFNSDVVQATIPTTAGEITILANHSPLINHVSTGSITLLLEEDKTQSFEVVEGVVHVKEDGVVEVMV